MEKYNKKQNDKNKNSIRKQLTTAFRTLHQYMYTFLVLNKCDWMHAISIVEKIHVK